VIVFEKGLQKEVIKGTEKDHHDKERISNQRSWALGLEKGQKERKGKGQ